MSIDYYSCKRCGKVYCDCGDYTICCGRDWCSDECAEEDGYIEGNCKIENEDCENYGENYDCFYSECEHYAAASCKYCRDETFEDSDILSYVLNILGRTKEDVISEMANAKNKI